MAPLPLEAPNSIRILVPTLASLSLAPQRGADVQRATCTSKRAGLTVQRAICTFMGEGHLVRGLQPISILVPRIWFHVSHASNDQNMPKTNVFWMANITFSGWCPASGILVSAGWASTCPKFLFKGFRGQEVDPILPHLCNAWMAMGEASNYLNGIASKSSQRPP